MKRTALTIILISFFLADLHATHIVGGDIRYEQIGQDSFIITLQLYRDCSGIAAPTSSIVDINDICGITQASIPLTLINPGGTDVSQMCPSAVNTTTCYGGTVPGFQLYEYVGLAVLQGQCSEVTVSWSNCCRNASNNVINGFSTNLYFDAKFENLNSTGNNSSPDYSLLGIPYLAPSQTDQNSLGIFDADGDSLFVEFTDPMDSEFAPVSWSPGFTTNTPFGPGSDIEQEYGSYSLSTGIVGLFNVSFKISEYDKTDGHFKGYIRRDMQVLGLPGTGTAPELFQNGVNNLSGAATQIDSGYIRSRVGDQFQFDVMFLAADTADSVSIESNILQTFGSSCSLSYSGDDTITATVSVNVVPGMEGYRYLTVSAINEACPVRYSSSQVIRFFFEEGLYAGGDTLLCQGDTSFLNSNSTGTTQWSVIGGDPAIPGSTGDPIVVGINFECTQCSSPWASPAQTTTYEVYDPSFAIDRDSITVYVVPNFNLNLLPGDTTICYYDSIQLHALTDQPFSYSYRWISNSILSNDTIENPVLLASVNSNWVSVTVTTDEGCIRSDEMEITNKLLPTDPRILGNEPLCLGDTALLYIDMGNASQIDSCIAVSFSCSDPDTAQIGFLGSSNGTTAYPAPYGNWYWGAKHQILYKASELHAMGLPSTGARLSSLGFDISSISTGAATTFDDFTIRMGCTNDNALITWHPGLHQVYYSSTETVNTPGWQNHEFQSEYAWDGVSNIIVEVCFNNSNFTENISTRYSSTSSTSVIYYRADNSTVCSTNASSGSSNQRPNVRFTYCSGYIGDINASWNNTSTLSNPDSISTFAYPVSTTTYTVVLSDSSGYCADTIDAVLEVVTQMDASIEMDSILCPSSPPDTALPVTPGGIYFGTGIIDSVMGIFDPSIAGVGVWPIVYTVSSPSGGCTNSDTHWVEVTDTIPVFIDTTEVCTGSGAVQLIASQTGGFWTGTGITNGVTGQFDPTGLAPGYYTVNYTVFTPCYGTVDGIVKVTEPYDFVFTQPQVNVCGVAFTDLNNYVQLISGPLIGSGPVNYTWTSTTPGVVDPQTGIIDNAVLSSVGQATVFLFVSAPDGSCGNLHSTLVQQVAEPGLELLSDPVGCYSTGDFDLVYAPALFSTGVTYVATPFANSTPLVINNFLNHGRVDVLASGAGLWNMNVNYADQNGCTVSRNDVVTILPLILPSFTYSANSGTVSFTNTTPVSTSFFWSFGDGATSTDPNPVHSYANSGAYLVSLTIHDSCGTPVVETETISINILGNSGPDISNEVAIYPNPADEFVIIEVPRALVGHMLRIYDMRGALVRETRISKPQENMEVNTLSEGFYLFEIQSNSGKIRKSIIIR
jgi:hypothetical protein